MWLKGGERDTFKSIAQAQTHIITKCHRISLCIVSRATAYTFPSQALPALIRKALTFPNEELSVWGSGEQYRDFLYVDDVCDALVLMAEKGMNKGVIQVGTGSACRLKDAAAIVARLAKKIVNKVAFRSNPDREHGCDAI